MTNESKDNPPSANSTQSVPSASPSASISTSTTVTTITTVNEPDLQVPLATTLLAKALANEITTEPRAATSDVSSDRTSSDNASSESTSNSGALNHNAPNNNALNHASSSGETHVQTESTEQLLLPEVPPPPAPIEPMHAVLTPLREVREQQSRTVEEMAGALRLSQAQIHALETNRWQALPGSAYVKGFLRNYARALNVNAQPYVDQYIEQTNPASGHHGIISQSSAHSGAQNTEHATGQSNTTSSAPTASISDSENAQASNTSIAKTAKSAASFALAGQDIIKNDPQALRAFSASGQEASSSKWMVGFITLIIASTTAFLMIWERDAWLPKIMPYVRSLSQSIGIPSSKPTAAPTATINSAAISSTKAASADASKSEDLKEQASVEVATLNATNASANNETPTANGAANNAARNASAVEGAQKNESKNNALTALNALTATQTAIQSAASLAESKKPATGPIREIELQFLKPVWIEIRDSAGNILSYGTKTQGAQTLKGHAPLSIVIGAANAVKMAADGGAIDVLSKSQGNVAKFSIP